MNKQPVLIVLRLSWALGLSLSLVLSEVTPASAGLLCYVKWDAAGADNGTSWADAYQSLQSALSSASICTEVWVAKGAYKPTAFPDPAASFHLKNGVAIFGGFAGTETLRTQRSPTTNPTILSGNIGDPAVATDNSYHVVVGSGTDSTALLDGFTITAGNASGTVWPDYAGGGMFNESGSPSLVNVTFSGNSANEGGGMFNGQSSSPSLTNVTFSGNSAADSGGGMCNQESSPSLTNVTFSSNNSGNLGAGMSSMWGSPSLTNVTFSSNSATISGGGMYNVYSGSPALVNVTFSGNSAASGGALSNQGGNTPTIKNSIFYGNTGGEIVSDASSTTTVIYSIVQGGHPGTGNLDANPLLSPLANHGGFTQTRVLGAGSPAIDRGTNTGCPMTDQRGIPRPQDGDLNGTATCDMGATESRLFTRTFASIGVQDGWVLESAETSGVGGEMNSTAETFSVGDYNDRQIRGILSFNTASLPDNVLITSAVLKIKTHSLIGGNPFGDHGKFVADMRKGPFGNNAALQLIDFQAPASRNAALIFQRNPANGWYSGVITAANRGYINKTGLTQFRLRFAIDDNNDGNSDYLRFYSGNAAILSNRPLFTVKYYLP